MMAELTTLTDDELLDKIIDELEFSARHPENISNNVHHDRCGNLHLYEMVARLVSECGALKCRMNQQHEMIVQLEKRLDSQTNEEQPDQHEPMQIMTAEIDTCREQQVKQEQMVQESNESQSEINVADIVITDEGLYDSNREKVISMRTDEQSLRIESLSDEFNEERNGFMTPWNNKSDEHGNVNQSLRMTQPTATMVDSITRILTDDGLSNTITEIERTDQQTAQQLNDTYNNKHCSGYPVEFSVGVQQVHQTQVKREQTVEASSPIEVPLNISSQSEQHQEFVRVRDASSAVEIKEQLNQLQIFISDRQRMNRQVMLREAHQLHLIEMSAVHDEATIEVTDSTQLQISEMETTNERSTLSDCTQMEEVSKSDNVQFYAEECSETGGIITLPNVSIDVEQEETMPSPQMKVCSIRIRKIDAKQIASNSETSRAPPKKAQKPRKKSQSHSCGVCNKRFISKSLLIIHSRVHTGERPYMCADCGAAFSRAGHLKIHQRIHSGERPYVCADCSAAFNQAVHLKIHQRIHSGEKPYVCTDCGLAFKQAFNLKVHQRTHSGEKPYLCSDCGVAFNHRSTLKKHKRIHSGEKPFICDFCKASFRLKRELSLHMDIHSGKKSYKCNVCNLEFRKKFSLKRHLEVHIRSDVGR